MLVLLVTGPLGSGKTVRVNQILSYLRESKMTVLCIVNDIGKENIDVTRIESIGEIAPLTQGCICCESASALEELVVQAYEKNTIDIVLIEPTGIADARVIHGIAHNHNFDWSCLALVDVKHFKQNRAIGSEQFQLPVATEVGLTWADGYNSITDPELQEVIEYIGLNSRNTVVSLLDKGSLDKEVYDRLLCPTTSFTPPSTEGSHKIANVRPVSIHIKMNVDEKTLLPILFKLQTEKGLVRAKGVSLLSNYAGNPPAYYEWDFVQGDFAILKKLASQPAELIGNFIGTEKGIMEIVLPLIDEVKMCNTCDKYKDQMDAFTGEIPGVSLEDTIVAIHSLLKEYPEPVKKDGTVLTNCEADTAKHLARRNGVPKELHIHSYRTSVEWRLKGFDQLTKNWLDKKWPNDYAFYRGVFILGKALINTLEIDWVNELMSEDIRSAIRTSKATELMLEGWKWMEENHPKEIAENLKVETVYRVLRYGTRRNEIKKEGAQEIFERAEELFKKYRDDYDPAQWVEKL